MNDTVNRSDWIEFKGPLVGRDADVERLTALLREDKQRILTLTGPGGVGKTRIGTEIGRELNEDFEGGTHFADLSYVNTVDGICRRIAQAMDLQLPSHTDYATGVGSCLAGRKRFLLVLDNFEHLIDLSAELLTQWVEAAPSSRFLVTSREPLMIDGEEEYRINPLEIPDWENLTVEQILSSPSVQLILKSSGIDLDPARVTDEKIHAMAVLANSLGGNPLALEMVGNCASTNFFRAILDESDDGKDVGEGVGDALDWNVDLMDEEERAAYGVAAAFDGGFVKPVFVSVIKQLGIARRHTPEKLLDQLQELKMLRTAGEGGRERYDMHFEVRQRGLETLGMNRLVRRPDVLAAHANAVGDYVGKWADRICTDRAHEAMERIQSEFENVFAALERAPGQVSPDDAARCLVHVAPVMDLRGFGRTLHELLERAMKLRPLQDRELELRLRISYASTLRNAGKFGRSRKMLEEIVEESKAFTGKLEMIALNSLSRTCLRAHTYEDVETVARQGLEVADREGDRRMHAIFQALVATSLQRRGELVEAVALLSEARDQLAECRDLVALTATLQVLGNAYKDIQNSKQAMESYQRSKAISETLKDRRGILSSLNNIANMHAAGGEFGEALMGYMEAETVARELGDIDTMALVISNRGGAEACLNREEDGLRSVREALELFALSRNPRGMALTNHGIADISIRLERPEDAREPLLESVRLLDEIGADKTRLQMMNYYQLSCVENLAGDNDAVEIWMGKAREIARALGMKPSGQDEKLDHVLKELGVS